MSEAEPQTVAGEVVQAAEALAHLDPPARIEALRSVSTEQQDAVFELLDVAHQHELLELAAPDEAARLVQALQPDDRARLFDELPDPLVMRLRARLSPRQRRMTDQLLAYGDESAGRIMTPEFVALRADMTAEQALLEVRANGRGAETVLVLPVLGDGGELLGMVTLDELVLAASGTGVLDLMHEDFPVARVEDDQEQVARRIQEADVIAMPVLDEGGRLVGLVTVDDAMDVIDIEESEDLARIGASEPLGRPYFATSLMRLTRSRVTWLLLLAVAATLTVSVLAAFEDELHEVVTLSLFIPLLIGVGGNSGAQSSTTIVRALAMGDVEFKDLLVVILREGKVGLLLGVTLGALGFVPVYLVFGAQLAEVISLSLVAICSLGALVGALMPILASRVGIDPAVVSAPVVTTVVDAGGLVVYFLIARAVLGI